MKPERFVEIFNGFVLRYEPASRLHPIRALDISPKNTAKAKAHLAALEARGIPPAVFVYSAFYRLGGRRQPKFESLVSEQRVRFFRNNRGILAHQWRLVRDTLFALETVEPPTTRYDAASTRATLEAAARSWEKATGLDARFIASDDVVAGITSTLNANPSIHVGHLLLSALRHTPGGLYPSAKSLLKLAFLQDAQAHRDQYQTQWENLVRKYPDVGPPHFTPPRPINASTEAVKLRVLRSEGWQACQQTAEYGGYNSASIVCRQCEGNTRCQGMSQHNLSDPYRFQTSSRPKF